MLIEIQLDLKMLLSEENSKEENSIHGDFIHEISSICVLNCCVSKIRYLILTLG